MDRGPNLQKEYLAVRLFAGKQGVKRKKGNFIAKSRDKSDFRRDLIQVLHGTGEMSGFLYLSFFPAGSFQVGFPRLGAAWKVKVANMDVAL